MIGIPLSLRPEFRTRDAANHKLEPQRVSSAASVCLLLLRWGTPIIRQLVWVWVSKLSKMDVVMGSHYYLGG